MLRTLTTCRYASRMTVSEAATRRSAIVRRNCVAFGGSPRNDASLAHRYASRSVGNGPFGFRHRATHLSASVLPVIDFRIRSRKPPPIPVTSHAFLVTTCLHRVSACPTGEQSARQMRNDSYAYYTHLWCRCHCQSCTRVSVIRVNRGRLEWSIRSGNHSLANHCSQWECVVRETPGACPGVVDLACGDHVASELLPGGCDAVTSAVPGEDFIPFPPARVTNVVRDDT